MNPLSPKRKLVIALPSYFEETMGGAEIQTKFLAHYARENHFEVSYVFLSDRNRYLNSSGINLFPVMKNRLFTKANNIKFPYFFSVLNLFDKIRPDIIYNRAGTAFTGIAAYYAKKNHCPYVFHIASDNDVQSPITPWFKPFLVPEYKLMQYGIKRANSVIAQTQFQAKQLMQNYGRYAVVAPNGHPIPENTAKKNDIITVLWVANWKPVKQPDVFVRLAGEIGRRQNVQCIMLGRTTDRYESLVRMAKENNIEVMGELPNDKVNNLLSQSHILVNTSQSEGFSNTFIQAWMRKVPVVSLQVDPDHIIEREGIGFCCTGNFEKLVGNTKRLIKDHELREQMGRKAREYAVQHHSLKNMELIIKVFDKLLPRTYAK